MNDIKRPEYAGDLQDDGEGVVQSWIDSGLDTFQAVLQGCVGVLDESRRQLHDRVAQTLDWAEGFPKGMFAVARNVNHSVDAVAAHSIAAGDRVGKSMLRALRHAGHSARGLASDASTAFVGNGANHAGNQPLSAAG